MSFQQRDNFGRRLEPDGHAILHGAGQSPDAFATYAAHMTPYHPFFFMTYLGMKGRSPEKVTVRLQEELAAHAPQALGVQMGLSMTRDGTPEEHYEQEVAAGTFDEAIQTLCTGLRELGCPVYLRIGYECNGQWNGYVPETYIAAWRRISAILEEQGCTNVARVWCIEPGADDTAYMKWYPGDDVVDWWSIDCFSTAHFDSPVGDAFCREARAHGFPVMIGESTPRYVTTLGGEASWAGWFQPYFDFIDRHPNIKALSYINWDWRGYPMWADWGDCRLESDPDLLARWKATLADPVFLHATATPTP